MKHIKKVTVAQASTNPDGQGVGFWLWLGSIIGFFKQW